MQLISAAPRAWLRTRIANSVVLLSVVTLASGLGCPQSPTVEPDPGPTSPTTEIVQASQTETPEVVVGAVAVGRNGAVTSAEASASAAGLEMLRRGGNAVDAAVAVGFALAVTHPSAGNLGGGGFMVVRMADAKVAAFDYREQAPGSASRDMYLDGKGEMTDDRLVGAKAAGIPGTVAGMALAHKRFGKLPWSDVVAPAVALARAGNKLDSWHVEDLRRGAKRMHDKGFHASAAHYERADGTPFAEGDLWVQPALADTLQMIASKGAQSFYSGEFAATMAKENVAAGGIWSAKDLADYTAIVRKPIVFDYRGHEIITMPPPSAGGVVLRQILAASELLELEKKPWRSVEEVHLYVEITRRTYADRNYLLADPDFVELPMKQLLDTQYVAKRMKGIDLDKATPSSTLGSGLPHKKESHQTTHFSVVDGEGNAVSNTYTLNLGFGARYVLPSSGVLLNNEMDDFSVKPGEANVFGLVQGEANKIEPGKRMLSSMTPTIIVKDGKLRAVIGSPGGPTITTTVVQITRAMLDYGLSIEQAVDATRIHHQWLPDRIMAEKRIPDALVEGLKARGHELVTWGSIGHANCIAVDPETGKLTAVADVSRDGGQATAY